MTVENKRHGWIKLYRSVADYFPDKNLMAVMIWCLMKATHRPTKVMMPGVSIDLQPGQFVTGRFVGASETCMAPMTFYKCLKRAEQNGFISLDSGNRHFTVVSVTKWEDYQQDAEPGEQPRNNPGTTGEHIQEVKNIRKRERAPKRLITDQDLLGPKGVAYATEVGMPDEIMDDQFVRFRDYHMAKGNLYSDWSAAWRTWCRNWKSFSKGG